MEPNGASVVNAETEGKRRMTKPERRKSTLSPSSLFRISSLSSDLFLVAVAGW